MRLAPWVRVAALAAVLAAGGTPVPATPSVGETSDSAAEGLTARADLELVERILEESGVVRTPPEAGLGDYLSHLARRLSRWWSSLFSALAETETAPAGRGLRMLLLIGAAAALLFVAVALGRWLLLRLDRDAPAGPSSTPAAVPAPAMPVAAETWWRIFETRLTEHRLGDALEALWWYAARSLSADDADPSWTGRELVERSGRADLGHLVRRLDALVYGPGEATTSAARELGMTLRGAIL